MTQPEGITVALVKETAELIKTVTELAKTFREDVEKKRENGRTHSSPLQVAGRLLIAVMTILAVSATVSGYVDAHQANGYITWATWFLRVGVLTVGGVTTYGTVKVITFLAKKHPSFLYSPTELSPSVHEAMVQQAKPVAEGEHEGEADEERKTKKEAEPNEQAEANKSSEAKAQPDANAEPVAKAEPEVEPKPEPGTGEGE